jgi:RNA polymerase-binding transcription factor DksA
MEPDEARELLRAELERLVTVLTTLSAQIHEDADTGELSQVDQHPADVASELFEMESGRAIASSMGTEFAEVEAAIGRLDAGTYGRCDRCGEPIGDERLGARPATRFCLEHELAMEGVAVPVDHHAAAEAARHLDLLPRDDEVDDDDLGLSAEEQALHEEG